VPSGLATRSVPSTKPNLERGRIGVCTELHSMRAEGRPKSSVTKAERNSKIKSLKTKGRNGELIGRSLGTTCQQGKSSNAALTMAGVNIHLKRSH
jgi:hypothetical protein